MERPSFVNTTIGVALALLLIFAAGRFLPFGSINWGRVSLLPAATITVTGSSQKDIKSQVADFTASVTFYNDDKQKAINEVNTKVEKLIANLKAFGIDGSDIKTQTVSVSEQPDVEIMIYPPRIQPGKWMVSNTIEIKLRNVDKASALTDLLSQSGATNVYGPNFSLDIEDKSNEADLLKEAVNDAKSKAEVVAKASGSRLGKVISVNESGVNYPIPLYEKAVGVGGDTSSPIEPGTQTSYKSVTVVFELK